MTFEPQGLSYRGLEDLPGLADLVGPDDDPGQVEAEEEDDDAKRDVGHVQLPVVLVAVVLL